MSQHDLILATIREAIGVQTEDRTVSGYTGHYLPNGLYFYVGQDPKRGGNVRITSNVDIGVSAPWQPRGTVRSSFMSDDMESLAKLCTALKDPATKPPVKAPRTKAPQASEKLLSELLETVKAAASQAPVSTPPDGQSDASEPVQGFHALSGLEA